MTKSKDDLRSRKWFNNPDDPEMTALYSERYLNDGLTREELQSGKPIIAIARTGSDLSPCNRHHPELSKGVRDGVATAGGMSSDPLRAEAGFVNHKGTLFDSAIMKPSVICGEFRRRYLSNPDDPGTFEGRAVDFDGPDDVHARTNDPAEAFDESCIPVMRGTGPRGYPGGAEVVNMPAPAYLLKKGVEALACIGGGRQSGTSGSPSILNASPEAADGGGAALLRNGDRLRVELKTCQADILVNAAELEGHCKALEATPDPGARAPGNRSSATWSNRSTRAWSCATRPTIAISPPRAIHATTTEGH